MDTGSALSASYTYTDRNNYLDTLAYGNGDRVQYIYTALVETINGTEFRTAYTYDDDNRVTGITSVDASESYAYDDYSRLHQKVTAHDGATVLTDTFTYRSPTESTTTGWMRMV